MSDNKGEAENEGQLVNKTHVVNVDEKLNGKHFVEKNTLYVFI